ncbi:hypothetical protein FOMPIDRAFT_1056434 [Fomitopsis schrenkii]|uniref:Uncharacterized protein n=1 Tax=Fomitopsis schrenkii TaxID=2126942 RepID=S8DNM5_FOMSC|nr:hypothetical protein FOMPIDRAFT_1056434 [Fomitopsis schrenkii]
MARICKTARMTTGGRPPRGLVHAPTAPTAPDARRSRVARMTTGGRPPRGAWDRADALDGRHCARREPDT